MNAVKQDLGDENYIYTIIKKKRLKNPIIWEKGGIKKDYSKNIQVLGEISRVLHDMVLGDTFDKEFRKDFPRITFLRYLNEICIPIQISSYTFFDEKEYLSFLSKVGLSGSISSIRRGYGSFAFGKGLHFDDENIL